MNGIPGTVLNGVTRDNSEWDTWDGSEWDTWDVSKKNDSIYPIIASSLFHFLRRETE